MIYLDCCVMGEGGQRVERREGEGGGGRGGEEHMGR